jgi:hypothetical protein
MPYWIKSIRSEMKKSRFKIWLRAFLLVLFGSLFAFYFVRDIAGGYFNWTWVVTLFVLFIPIGFWMSRIVPMQPDRASKTVTLSLDRTYLILIWILVIAKLVASHTSRLIPLSDVIMCAILGIMFGRLGGIGLRVRHIKTENGFLHSK